MRNRFLHTHFCVFLVAQLFGIFLVFEITLYILSDFSNNFFIPDNCWTGKTHHCYLYTYIYRVILFILLPMKTSVAVRNEFFRTHFCDPEVFLIITQLFGKSYGFRNHPVYSRILTIRKNVQVLPYTTWNKE